jgi:hypothetical protein
MGAYWTRLVAKDEIAMDRGLRAQLSPNEMMVLRRLKLGARKRPGERNESLRSSRSSL